MRKLNFLLVLLPLILLSACVVVVGPMPIGPHYGIDLPSGHKALYVGTVVSDDKNYVMVQLAREPVPFAQYLQELPQREADMHQDVGLVVMERENVTVFGSQPGILVTSRYMTRGMDVTKFKLATADNEGQTIIFMADMPTDTSALPTPNIKAVIKQAVLTVQRE